MGKSYARKTIVWTWSLHCIYNGRDLPLLQALVFGNRWWKLFGGFKNGTGEEKGKGKEKRKGEKERENELWCKQQCNCSDKCLNSFALTGACSASYWGNSKAPHAMCATIFMCFSWPCGRAELWGALEVPYSMEEKGIVTQAMLCNHAPALPVLQTRGYASTVSTTQYPLHTNLVLTTHTGVHF